MLIGPTSDEGHLRRFGRLREGFAQAARRGCAAEHYRLLGRGAVLRIAGERLADRVAAPFAHLRGDAPQAPDLTIELWDVAATGVPGLEPSAVHAVGETWDLGDETCAVSPGGRFVSHELPGSVIWLDRERAHLVGWFDDARALSLYQRGKPLHLVLSLWAGDCGVQALHAALVARDGCGVLLVGRSGAGKSTVALSALQRGWTFLSDDWVGVREMPGGVPVGHGLYATAFVDPVHLGTFPRLPGDAVGPTHADDRKALLLLPPLGSERLTGSTPLRAIVLLRIVDAAESRLRVATKAEALIDMALSALFGVRPRGGRGAVDRLSRMLQVLPAYRLEMGRDLRRIPERLDELLEQVTGGAPGAAI